MRKSCLAKAAAAAASAYLMWAAFPPSGETANAAVMLAPLLAISRSSRPKRAAAWLFASGFAFWFATLSWMPAICKNNGPWPLVLLGWAGLSALCAGYFALFGALDSLLWRSAAAKRPGGAILAVLSEPVLWAGCEWLRATLFSGFAWNFAGTALAGAPAFIAPARYGGAYFVSAMVVLLNGVFATLALRAAARFSGAAAPQSPSRFAKIARSCETAVPLALVCALIFLPGRPAGETARSVRVALVQRNAPCIFRAGAEREDPFAVFDALHSSVAPARPDLVVWAESAMAEFGPLWSPPARRAAQRYLELTGARGLLAGGDDNSNSRAYNAAALYQNPERGPEDIVSDPEPQIYRKQHLVPFGEYIPFDKTFSALQKLSPIGLSLWPGEAKVLSLDLGGERGLFKFAPLVCYEDTDGRLSRKAAKLGAQAIVLITNDSWFSGSPEAMQHAVQSVLRAVETGLPVIRVGNSGVTGVISPSGRARWLDDGFGGVLTDRQGTMVESVAYTPGCAQTPYTRLGDAPLATLFALLCAALALQALRAKKSFEVHSV